MNRFPAKEEVYNVSYLQRMKNAMPVIFMDAASKDEQPRTTY